MTRPGSLISIMFGGPDKEVEDDFKNVPKTDSGNDNYNDRGKLGSYTPEHDCFDAPKDVKYFEGYGGTEEDLKRGFIKPAIRQVPNYDLDNYKDRSTLPIRADEDNNNSSVMPDDWEFRNRNRRSRGFLTRPTNSTER